MKITRYRLYLNLLRYTIFLLISTSTLAATNNNQQPLYISSMKQSIDMITSTVTLTGKVIIRRGSICIHADKVVMTHLNNKDSNKIIEGYGNPVIFYQLQKDGKPLYGHARKVRYEIINDLLIFTDHAYLAQLDNNVKGDCIIYFIKKQQMEAFSNKGKQVTTILVPTQLLAISKVKTPNKFI